MNAAGLRSPRLQRVLKVLRDGRPHTTRQIVRKAGVMAVNACVSELRQNGAEIDCERRMVTVTLDGEQHRAPRFYYTMTKGPDDA